MRWPPSWHRHWREGPKMSGARWAAKIVLNLRKRLHEVKNFSVILLYFAFIHFFVAKWELPTANILR